MFSNIGWHLTFKTSPIITCSKSHQYRVQQTYQNDLNTWTLRGSAFSDKQNDHLKLSWFPCKLERALPFGGYIPVWDVFKILSAFHYAVIWFEFPIHSSTNGRISQPLLTWRSIFKDLGKLQYFTQLNLVALKGGWFPYNSPWFEGSGEKGSPER